MSLRITAACGCKIGKVRTKNEDNFYFDGKHLEMRNNGLAESIFMKSDRTDTELFAVFDGMGGERGGERAAYLAAESLKNDMPRMGTGEALAAGLAEYCQTANTIICKRAKEAKYTRMGTTAAILAIDGDVLYTCNVGDSRVYRLRENRLQQLTLDHTEHLPPNHGTSVIKPRLTQYLGIFPNEMIIQPSISRHSCRSHDRFLLCSDGLTDFLSDSEIQDALGQNREPQKSVDHLMDLTMSRAAKDNITAIVVEVSDAAESGQKKGNASKLIAGALVAAIALGGIAYAATETLRTPEPAPSLSVVIEDETQLGLMVGQEKALVYTVEPEDSSENVSVYIEDTDIAEYINGSILAKSVGQTRLVIQDSTNNQTLAEMKITVFPFN